MAAMYSVGVGELSFDFSEGSKLRSAVLIWIFSVELYLEDGLGSGLLRLI
jgi:hypothetical protein